MKKILSVFLMLAGTSPAFALVDGGLGTISGANGYSGMMGYLQIDSGKNWYVKPSFNTYRSDYSGGTFATYAGRVGYDTEMFGVGLEGGATPKVNGYRNTFVSGDITFSLSPAGGQKARLAGPRSGAMNSKGDGIARIDVGAAYTYIAHENDLNAAGQSDAFKVGESDAGLFAGVQIFGAQVSGRYTKNLGYTKTLDASLRDPQKIDLTGMLIATQGFLNQSWNARIDYPALPFISPYFSYTFTQFKVGRPSAKAYLIGTSIGLKMINLNVAYQIFDQGEGYSTKNYFSVGAGLNF